MAAYIIIEAKTKDAESYASYMEQVLPIVARHEGQYHVRTSHVTPVVGGWTPERIVVLEFPTRQHIKRCFSSLEYQEIAPLRDAGADFRTVIVDGYTPGDASQDAGSRV